MVHLSFVLVSSLAALSATAVPIEKRIAQSIAESTAKWEQSCLAAGGDQKCNPISITAFTTLLAAAGPCEQQNAADSMIDLAKTLGNDAQMIKLAQVFAQQPRNTPSAESVPYCQQAPKNPELNGLFQCQFAGAKTTTFVGGVAVGQPGTIPFGQSEPLSPAGSCPAHPDGPIPDGTQLVDITQNPGSGATTSTPVTQQLAASPLTADAQTTAGKKQLNVVPVSASTSFQLQNGKDAQKLNAKFATLTDDSVCSSGETACIEGAFAQCVNKKFLKTKCASTLVCAALPLVNSPGTSITCTTTADAEARIAATGAQGGIVG